jgi:hypothetical protein
MQRSLLLLALAALFVGCNSVQTASVVPAGDVRFSWEKDAPAPAADPTRATVRKVRSDLSLIEIGVVEKRDSATKLQLTKYGKSFNAEVIKADETSMVVGITSSPNSTPEVLEGDDLSLAVLAQ